MQTKQGGFITVAIIILIVGLSVIAGTTYYYLNKMDAEESVSVENQTQVENENSNTKELVSDSKTISQESPATTTTTTLKVVATTTVKVDTSTIKTNTPVSGSNSVDTQFDVLFARWIEAWNKRDVNTLINTFGYDEGQVQNMEDKNIWHYNSYELYKSKSTSPSSDDISYYKQYGGEVPYDVKVTGYYIISKSSSSYNIAIINGNYKKSVDVAAITQWQIYPSEYNPKIYTSAEDAKKDIDKIAGI